MSDSFPKLRNDLVISSDTIGEQVVYTVKDPLTSRFFRLRAPEYYLLTRADGQTTAAQAAQLTSERFGIHVPSGAAEAFFTRMAQYLFFEGGVLERELPRLRHMSQANRRRSIGTIRLKAFDPDALLSRWIQRLRFLFRPVSVGAAVVLMLGAALIAIGQQESWGVSLVRLWRLSSIPILFGAILTVGFVHEFGHALTLKYYGGSVREMGFLLLYFQPCFYTNLSDAYLLNRRHARLFVGLAGLFFQGLLTAVLVLLWRVTTPGTLPSIFFSVSIAFSVGVFLFNFNPLIRLDGYYLLADWLRIPNLRARAFSYWKSVLREWITGLRADATEIPKRLRRIFRWYGIGASIYTGLLVGWVMYHLTIYIVAHWGFAGAGLLYAIVLAFALHSKGAAVEKSSGEAMPSIAGSSGRRLWKPLLLWGGLGLILLLLVFIRAERRVGSACRVEPSARYTVWAPARDAIESELFIGQQPERREKSVLQAGSADFSSILYTLHIKEGDAVHQGDTLLVLSCNRYLAELASAQSQRERTVSERNLLLSGPKKDQVTGLRAEIAEIAAQLDNKRLEVQRAEQLWDRQLIAKESYESIKTELRVLQAKHDAKKSALALLISDPKADELAIKDAIIAGLDSQISFLRSQIEASTLRAPIDGLATRVDRGGVLVEVASLDPVRVRLPVDEDDIPDVSAGFPVTLKVRSLPFDEFSGHVTHVAFDADTTGGKRQFAVLTEIDNRSGSLKPGMTGYAKVSCGSRSVLSLIFRRLVHFIRVEFWSWW